MIEERHDPDEYKQSIILVINKNDHEKCLYEGKGSELLQQNISTVILPLQQEQSDSIFLASLKDDGLLNAGSILVQSPYDSEKYVVASSALLQFSIDKYMYFSQLCQFLGAKEVTVNEVSSKNKKERKNLNLELSYKDNKISANYKDKELERLKSILELSDTFEGSEPDIKGAERLLRTYRLKSDSEMKALLQMRSIGTNTLKSRKFISKDLIRNSIIIREVKMIKPNPFIVLCDGCKWSIGVVPISDERQYWEHFTHCPKCTNSMLKIKPLTPAKERLWRSIGKISTPDNFNK